MTPIVPSPTVRLPATDRGGLLLHFAAGDFVGREDRHDLGHAGPLSSDSLCVLTIVADRRDDGALGADDDVGLQAQRLDALDHVLDVRWRGLFFHDNDHGGLSPVTGGWTNKVVNSANSETRLVPVGQTKKAPRPDDSGLGAVSSLRVWSDLEHSSPGPATRRAKIIPKADGENRVHDCYCVSPPARLQLPEMSEPATRPA